MNGAAAIRRSSEGNGFALVEDAARITAHQRIEMRSHARRITARILPLLVFAVSAAAQLSPTAANMIPGTDAPIMDTSTGIALPCVGCTVSTFAAGTNTPLKTYTDSTLTTQNGVIITLNSSGYSTSGIWIGPSCYKFVLKSAAGSTIRTQDHICDNALLLKSLYAATGGAALIGFEQAGSSTARTVQAKLYETVSVLDFGADSTGGVSSQTAIDDAISSLASGGTVTFPVAGTYLISTPISVPSNINISCVPGASIKTVTAHGGVMAFDGVTNSGVDACDIVAANGTPAVPVDTTSGVAVRISGGSSHITVSNNNISGYEYGGVLIGKSGEAAVNTHLLIQRNYLADGVDMSAIIGTPLATSIFAIGAMTDSVISENTVLSHSDLGIGCEPFAASGNTCERNTFRDNDVRHQYTYGYISYADTGSDATLVVSNNDWIGNKASDIHSRVSFGGPDSQAGECFYSVNSVNGYNSGMQCTDVMIGRTGIQLPLGAISISNGQGNHVVGAHILRSAWGCAHDVSANLETSGTVGNIWDGIECKDADHFGLKVEGSNNSKVSNLNVEGAGSVDGPGLWVVNSTHVSVDKANIFNNGVQGVVVDSQSDHFKLTNSHIKGNAGPGYVGTAQTQTVSGNTFENNTGDGLNITTTNGHVAITDNVAIDSRWTVASGTYTSGITTVGSAGQTCILAFSGAGGGTATVQLTGANTIAGGTALAITNAGQYSRTPVAATVSRGTATSCSGTAAVSTTLNGAGVLQTLGFAVSDNISGCDTAVPQTCSFALMGNTGAGNSPDANYAHSTLWEISAITMFSSVGNESLNDHVKDGATLAVGGISIASGACRTWTSSAMGESGVQKGRPTVAIDTHLADPVTSNWGLFNIFPPIVNGNLVSIRMCNNTGGALTPTTLYVNIGWSN